MKKVILFLLLIIVMCEPAISQKRKSSPLRYTLSLVETKTADKQLVVSAQITNISKSNIVIDKKGLIFNIVYKKVGKELPNGAVTNGEALVINPESPFGEAKGDYLVLSPNQAYSEEFKFSIKDDFFEPQRTYKLILTYGQFEDLQYDGNQVWQGRLDSNEMIFEITDE